MRVDDYIEHSDSSGAQTIGNGRGMYVQQPEPLPVVYETVKLTLWQKLYNTIKAFFRRSTPIEVKSSLCKNTVKGEVGEVLIITNTANGKSNFTRKLHTTGKVAISVLAAGAIVGAGFLLYHGYKKGKRK